MLSHASAALAAVRRAPRRGLAASIALAAAVFVALPASQSMAFGTPLVTGVTQIAASAADGPLAYSRVRAAGAAFVHTELIWSKVAPASRPAGFDPANPDSPGYNWADADRQVQLAAANGLQPILAIFRAPSWAQGGTPVPTGISAPDPVQLGLFAQAAARRYDGSHGLPRVRYWTVWNEPNASLAMTPQVVAGQSVSIARYRDMVNQVAAAVHGVRADDVVVGGELFPNGANNSVVRSIAPLAFMRGLFCLSAGRHPHRVCSAQVHADIWSTHPYSSGSPQTMPANPDNVWIGNLPKEGALIRAAQQAGTLVSSRRVGFWVTEYGWDTKPPNRKGVPMTLDRRWLAESVYRMWSAGVSLASYFELRDESSPTMFQSGLYFNCAGGVSCDQAKPILTAFSFPFVAYTSKNGTVLVWGRTPSGVRGRVSIQASSGRSWRSVKTLSTDGDGIFTARVRPPARLGRRGNLRAVLSGGATSAPFSLVRPHDLLVAPFG